jgi:hypothetical protein
MTRTTVGCEDEDEDEDRDGEVEGWANEEEDVETHDEDAGTEGDEGWDKHDTQVTSSPKEARVQKDRTNVVKQKSNRDFYW